MATNDTGTMRIGQLAAQAGVTADAVRYYERAGVLPRPVRGRSSNYRLYGPAALARLQLVRQARALGLSLREIRALLRVRDTRHSETRCREVRGLLAEKVAWLDRRIQELQQFRDTLTALRCTCDRSLAERSGRDCAVFSDVATSATDSPAPRSS